MRGVRRGFGGIRGGDGGTSWVWGYVGVREELVKSAVFGHFLENYYILAAPR